MKDQYYTIDMEKEASYQGIEKSAVSAPLAAGVYAGIGALGGGEKDKKTSEKTNRHIGALRGLGFFAGEHLAHTALGAGISKAVRSGNRRGADALARASTGIGVLGGLAGYMGMRHFGPKYNEEIEQKRKAEGKMKKSASLAHHLLDVGVFGGIGALGGGEKDKETGKKTNRHIGAARGLGALVGTQAGLQAGKYTRSPHAQIGLGILGGYGGYKATKHLGPKYNKEREQERQEGQMKKSASYYALGGN